MYKRQDKDFRGESFGVMPELLTRAEFVTKLTAVCAKCGAPATRTQRLVNGKPAGFEDPIAVSYTHLLMIPPSMFGIRRSNDN